MTPAAARAFAPPGAVLPERGEAPVDLDPPRPGAGRTTSLA